VALQRPPWQTVALAGLLAGAFVFLFGMVIALSVARASSARGVGTT